jgi:MFS family permease
MGGISVTSQIKRQFEKLGTVLDSVAFGSVHRWLIFLVALGAIFDAVEQYNAGYAAPLLVKQWHISNGQVGLLTTFTFGGMALGSLIAGILGDIVGRRVTYMYNLGLYTLGALIGAFAPNIGVLFVGRLIVGLGLGGELNTGLTIVSEFVPTKNRGSSVAIVNLAAGGLGIFLSAASSFLILGPMSGFLGGDTHTWRWLFGILAIPALLLWVYRVYIPESPRFLLSKGRIEEANAVLSMITQNTLKRKNVVTQSFLGAGSDQLEKEQVRLSEIFARGLGSRTVGLWIISWMTFGSQVAITVFMPTVLISEGFTVVNSLFYTMVINVGGLIGAILASYFGGKLGRKVVLGWGALVAVMVAVVFGQSHSSGMVIVFGALLQLMFMLLNTTTWLFAPELYPTRVRAFGTGASVVVALIGASVMPYVSGAVFGAWHASGLLIMVAVMYAIMALTVWRLVTETKDRSLEQISEIAIQG